MRRKLWIIPFGFVLLLAMRAGALPGLEITNNAELARNPAAYWSTAIVFHDELVSVASDSVRFGWSRYTRVQGRDVAFYLAQDNLGEIRSLAPGDKYSVSAAIRNERPGLVIVALGVEADSFSIRAEAGENGTIKPEGVARMERGQSREYRVAANPGFHIAEIRVDGAPVGGRAERELSYAHRFDSVTASHTIAASFAPNTYELTIVSEAPAVTPGPGTWILKEGEEIAIRAEAEAAAGEGSRWVCKGWAGTGDASGSGEGREFKIRATRDTTVEWTWARQHELRILPPAGGVVSGREGWYAEGEKAALSARPEGEASFSGWTGDVPDGRGDSPALEVAMDRPRTLGARFDVETRAVTPRAGAHGAVKPAAEFAAVKGRSAEVLAQADPGYHIAEVRVDGTSVENLPAQPTVYTVRLDKVLADRVVEVFFDPNPCELKIDSEAGPVVPAPGICAFVVGDKVTASAPSEPVAGAAAGERYAPLGWTGGGDVPSKGDGSEVSFTLTQNSRLKWQWRRERELTLDSTPGGEAAGVGGWHGADEMVEIEAMPSPGYVFAGWTGDAPKAQAAGKRLKVKMDRPRFITAEFKRDAFTVSARSGKGGRIEPSGPIEVDRGQAADFRIRADPFFTLAEVRVDGVALTNLPGGAEDYACKLENIAGPRRVEASFAPKVYAVDVVSAQGTLTPPAGVVRVEGGAEFESRLANAAVAGAEAGSRFVCRGWIGEGDTPATGEGSTVKFRVTRDSKVTWLWDRECELKAGAGQGGTVEGGGGWRVEGATATLNAVADSGHVFAGWTGDVPEKQRSDNPLVLTVDRPLRIGAEFARDLLAIMAKAGPGGTIRPDGRIEVDRGSSLKIEIRADEHYRIDRVLADGQSVPAAAGKSEYIHTFQGVDSPNAIEVSFAPEQFRLTIKSDSNDVTPAPGTYRHDYGAEVTATAGAPSPEEEPGARRVVSGWKGTGDVPAAGKGAEVRVTIAQNSSLTWLWARQYELTLATQGAGRIEGKAGWREDGAEAVLRALPDQGAIFRGWSGDVPPDMAEANPLSLVMDRARSVSAGFKRKTFSIRASAGGKGRIGPSGEALVEAGGRAVFTVTADNGSAISRVLVDGKPADGLGIHQIRFEYVFENVSEPHRIEAEFSENRWSLTVESDRPGASPAAGTHWIEEGLEIELSAPEFAPSENIGERFVPVAWKGSGDIPGSGRGRTLNATLSRDSTLRWIWAPEYELTVRTSGAGRVVGQAGWYAQHAEVSLTAEAQGQGRFTGWLGDAPPDRAASNPLLLTMDRARSVTAAFSSDVGILDITVVPESGSWSVVQHPDAFTGPFEGTGSVDALSVAPGAYTIRYEEIPGQRAPQDQTLDAAPGRVAAFSGLYQPESALGVSETRIEASLSAGQGLSNRTFEVWNAEEGLLKYAVTRNVPWMALSPRIGESAGERDVIRLDFDARGLAPGVHTGLVTVAARDRDILPREVVVVLTIDSIAAAAPVRDQNPAAGLKEGLIAYYALDGNALDQSPYLNHAMVRGPLTYAPHPPFGDAGQFNRRGEIYLEAAHRPHLKLTDSFSLQFWYKSGAFNGRILQKMWPARRTENREWEVSIRDDSRVLFKYTAPGAAEGYEFLCPLDASWARAAWNHFAYVYSAPDNRMVGYLNGEPATNQAPKYALLPMDTELPLLFMRDRYQAATGDRFDAQGLLDEVAIWNRSLSPDEVRALYLNGIQGSGN